MSKAKIQSSGLFDLFGLHGEATTVKVALVGLAHCGEYLDGEIRISDRLRPSECLMTMFHELAHALWDREGLPTKADEESVCEVIAEGLAQIVISGQLDKMIESAQKETEDDPVAPCRTGCIPRLATDCQGIDELAAEWNDYRLRNTIGDFPHDMTSDRDRNRELIRGTVAAIRKHRKNLEEKPLRWTATVDMKMIDALQQTLRIRLAWRHGSNAQDQP